MSKKSPKVAFLLQDLDIGGVEKTVVTLLRELVKYPLSLDLVLFKKKGVFLNELPSEVRVIELDDVKSRLRRVLPVVKYLHQEKPDVLVAQLARFNVIAAIAKVISRHSFRLVLVEQIGFRPVEENLKDNPEERIGLLNFLRRFFYPKANVIAAVSWGTAQEIEEDLQLRSGTIKVLYNPILDEEALTAKTEMPITHPYLQPNQPPCFLGVGRLTTQKDFVTLIEAFSILRQKRLAHLIILGKGNDREKLEALVKKLNLSSEVSLPGFSDNPYAYMSKVTAFVLSSEFESFGLVIAEALASGCQVISTDCPYGPSEILESGKYGTLVPVRDTHALASAMEQAIDSPINPDILKLRSQDFSVEKIAQEYLKVMNLK